MPLAFGGRIRTLEDIKLRLAAGADMLAVLWWSAWLESGASRP